MTKNLKLFYLYSDYKLLCWLQVDKTADLGIEREPAKGAAKVSIPLGRVVIHY